MRTSPITTSGGYCQWLFYLNMFCPCCICNPFFHVFLASLKSLQCCWHSLEPYNWVVLPMPLRPTQGLHCSEYNGGMKLKTLQCFTQCVCLYVVPRHCVVYPNENFSYFLWEVSCFWTIQYNLFPNRCSSGRDSGPAAIIPNEERAVWGVPQRSMIDSWAIALEVKSNHAIYFVTNTKLDSTQELARMQNGSKQASHMFKTGLLHTSLAKPFPASWHSRTSMVWTCQLLLTPWGQHSSYYFWRSNGVVSRVSQIPTAVHTQLHRKILHRFLLDGFKYINTSSTLWRWCKFNVFWRFDLQMWNWIGVGAVKWNSNDIHKVRRNM